MSDGFNFYELDKLTMDMLDFVNDFEKKETKKFVRNSARKLKNITKKKYKSMGIGLDNNTKTKEDKKIISRFKYGKVYKYNDDWSCRAYNSSPHAHLINNGFIHKPHKNQHGNEKFVPGYHFIERSGNEFKEQYLEDLEQFISNILDEKGL